MSKYELFIMDRKISSAFFSDLNIMNFPTDVHICTNVELEGVRLEFFESLKRELEAVTFPINLNTVRLKLSNFLRLHGFAQEVFSVETAELTDEAFLSPYFEIRIISDAFNVRFFCDPDLLTKIGNKLLRGAEIRYHAADQSVQVTQVISEDFSCKPYVKGCTFVTPFILKRNSSLNHLSHVYSVLDYDTFHYVPSYNSLNFSSSRVAKARPLDVVVNADANLGAALASMDLILNMGDLKKVESVGDFTEINRRISYFKNSVNNISRVGELGQNYGLWPHLSMRTDNNFSNTYYCGSDGKVVCISPYSYGRSFGSLKDNLEYYSRESNTVLEFSNEFKSTLTPEEHPEERISAGTAFKIAKSPLTRKGARTNKCFIMKNGRIQPFQELQPLLKLELTNRSSSLGNLIAQIESDILNLRKEEEELFKVQPTSSTDVTKLEELLSAKISLQQQLLEILTKLDDASFKVQAATEFVQATNSLDWVTPIFKNKATAIISSYSVSASSEELTDGEPSLVLTKPAAELLGIEFTSIPEKTFSIEVESEPTCGQTNKETQYFGPYRILKLSELNSYYLSALRKVAGVSDELIEAWTQASSQVRTQLTNVLSQSEEIIEKQCKYDAAQVRLTLIGFEILKRRSYLEHLNTLADNANLFIGKEISDSSITKSLKALSSAYLQSDTNLPTLYPTIKRLDLVEKCHENGQEYSNYQAKTFTFSKVITKLCKEKSSFYTGVIPVSICTHKYNNLSTISKNGTNYNSAQGFVKVGFGADVTFTYAASVNASTVQHAASTCSLGDENAFRSKLKLLKPSVTMKVAAKYLGYVSDKVGSFDKAEEGKLRNSYIEITSLGKSNGSYSSCNIANSLVDEVHKFPGKKSLRVGSCRHLQGDICKLSGPAQSSCNPGSYGSSCGIKPDPGPTRTVIKCHNRSPLIKDLYYNNLTDTVINASKSKKLISSLRYEPRYENKILDVFDVQGGVSVITFTEIENCLNEAFEAFVEQEVKAFKNNTGSATTHERRLEAVKLTFNDESTQLINVHPTYDKVVEAVINNSLCKISIDATKYKSEGKATIAFKPDPKIIKDAVDPDSKLTVEKFAAIPVVLTAGRTTLSGLLDVALTSKEDVNSIIAYYTGDSQMTFEDLMEIAKAGGDNVAMRDRLLNAYANLPAIRRELNYPVNLIKALSVFVSSSQSGIQNLISDFGIYAKSHSYNGLNYNSHAGNLLNPVTLNRESISYCALIPLKKKIIVDIAAVNSNTILERTIQALEMERISGRLINGYSLKPRVLAYEGEVKENSCEISHIAVNLDCIANMMIDSMLVNRQTLISGDEFIISRLEASDDKFGIYLVSLT